MLASGGVLLTNNEHAAQAYSGLFTYNALRQARLRTRAERRGGDKSGNGTQTCDISYKESLIGNVAGLGSISAFRYQLAGDRRKPGIALSLRPIEATQAFLRARLGRVLSLQQLSWDELQPSVGREGPGEPDTPEGPFEPFDHVKFDAIMRQARDVYTARWKARGDRGKG
jgi:hypothetical protein